MAPDTQQTELFEEIAALAQERLGGGELDAALSFIALYYAGVSQEDLAERRPDDLYGAAVAHLNLARRRAPGEAKVRVYNPEIEQHGWQSTHTIVEIVTDDLPFLVDSVRMVLNARGYTSHLVIHPVLRVRRGDKGSLEAVLPVEEAGGGGAGVEAVVHIETDRQTERDVLDAIAAEMLAALGDVRVAVEDWGGMRERMRLAIEELDALPPSVGGGEREEVKAFLEWIEDNHFTFLGYCASRVERACGAGGFAPEPDSGLGLLRGEGGPAPVPDLPGPGGMDAAELLAITRADRRSRVHRPSHLDCIALRRFDADGNVAGEHRFLGLYTSEAFNRAPRDIPLLRQKADALQRRAGYPPGSHAAKALQNIVDTFPRELLFQIPAGELFETATGILHLQERQRIRLFIHPDRFGRFYSCIVFVPRDRYNTRSRQVIQGILEEALGATDTEFTVRLSESVLARLFFVMRVEAGHAPQYDLADLERRLRVVSRTWTDDLHDALLDRFGEEAGTSLFRRYGEAFRADYREAYSARVAVLDVEKMERIRENGIEMSLYRPLEAEEGRLRFKLFQLGQRPVALSDALPMLENMGLKVEDEHPSKIKRTDAPRVWLHDFGLLHGEGPDFEPDRIEEIFREAFARVWTGGVENDGFNRLVLRAGIGWREIVILRAYCKYLRQAGTAFSEAYIQDALAANPGDRGHAGRAVRGPPRPGPAGGLSGGEERGGRPARRRARGPGPDRGRARAGRESRRGPHPAQLSGRDRRDPAHQLLPAGRRRRAEALPLLQARPAADSGTPGAAAAIRDFRLFAARRGRASARRRGGARRHTLVGPARGFPHRGAGARQGADGEECGDRPGRLQGRLLSQEAAGLRRPRSRPGGRHRLLPDLRARHAGHHRQPRRRPGGPAGACRAP